MEANVLKNGNVTVRLSQKEAFQLLYILDCDYNKSKAQYVSMKGNTIDKEFDKDMFAVMYNALTDGMGSTKTEDTNKGDNNE